MSEEASKITSVVKSEKNPKRVEQGRRLAAISKEAKERKKLERENAIKESLYNNDNNNNVLVGGLVVATVLVGAAVYFLWKKQGKPNDYEKVTIEEEPKEPNPRPAPNEVRRPKRSFVPYSMSAKDNNNK